VAGGWTCRREMRNPGDDADRHGQDASVTRPEDQSGNATSSPAVGAL
jgi:hypothetical protein